MPLWGSVYVTERDTDHLGRMLRASFIHHSVLEIPTLCSSGLPCIPPGGSDGSAHGLLWQTSATHLQTAVRGHRSSPRHLVPSSHLFWLCGRGRLDFSKRALKAANPEGLSLDRADPQVLPYLLVALQSPPFRNVNTDTMLMYYTCVFTCSLCQDEIFWDIMRYFL